MPGALGGSPGEPGPPVVAGVTAGTTLCPVLTQLRAALAAATRRPGTRVTFGSGNPPKQTAHQLAEA